MAVPPIAEKPSKTMIPRRYPRQRIESLVYVDLSAENGGFPIDICEDGVAFQGILPLKKDQELCVAFKLPGTDGTVTAKARIVWLNNSKKGGALQFIDLPTDSRDVLGKWLSSQRNAGNLAQNRTDAHPGVVMKPMQPLPGISFKAGRNQTPAKGDKGIAPSEPIPVLPANSKSERKKTKDAFAFDLYPGGEAKSRPRVAALVSVLSILVVVVVVNLWPFRTVLFPHSASVTKNPAPVAVSSDPAAPTPDDPLPLSKIDSVELSVVAPRPPSRDDSSVRIARTASATSILSTNGPERSTNATGARTQHTKPAKRNSAAAQPVENTRPTVAAGLSVSNTMPAAAPSNTIPAGSNEVPASEPSGAKSSASNAAISQEPALPTGTVEVKSDPRLSVHMTPELQWRASWPGINAIFGRLVSSVDPAYPKDALRQHIAGSVRLHVVISRSGTVEKIESADGPAQLTEAARKAVQQWHFEPSSVGGQPIEAEGNVTIVFRLGN